MSDSAILSTPFISATVSSEYEPRIFSDLSRNLVLQQGHKTFSQNRIDLTLGAILDTILIRGV
jgi:hypothetical protein